MKIQKLKIYKRPLNMGQRKGRGNFAEETSEEFWRRQLPKERGNWDTMNEKDREYQVKQAVRDEEIGRETRGLREKIRRHR